MKLLTLFTIVSSVITSCCASDTVLGSEEHTISKALHPIVGYLEHLGMFGLWGQSVKYLLTDDRAFAQHLIYADYETKKIINDEAKYREILDGLLKDYSSIISILTKLPGIISKIKDVKSKTTGQSLGDALRALMSIQLNKDAVSKFVKLWNEYECTVEPKDQVHVPRIPPTMKDRLFENPDAMTTLLSDPIAMHEISSNMLRTVDSINFKSSLNAIKHFVQLIRVVFPNLLLDILQSSRSVTDPLTNGNLGDALETILNIINQPRIDDKLFSIIETERAKVLSDPKQYGKFLQEMIAESNHKTGKSQSSNTKENLKPVPQLRKPTTVSGKQLKKAPTRTISNSDIDDIVKSATMGARKDSRRVPPSAMKNGFPNFKLSSL